MDAQRLIGGLTVGVLVLAGLGLFWLATAPPSVPDPPVPTPQPAVPVPSPRAPPVVPPPAPGPMARRTLPAPTDRPVRPPPPPNAPRAKLSTEQWRDYNESVHEMVTRAREACLRPYVRDAGLGRIEVVVDAVLWEGEVVDFGIRGLQDVPDHVIDCVADEAWATPFPRHELAGEVRLQRSVPVEGRLAD